MRKLLIVFILSFLFCHLTACGQKQGTETEKTPSEIMEAVIDSQSDLPELIHVTTVDEEFDIYLSYYYRLEQEQIVDGALCYADGVEASEIAVLVLADDADKKVVEETLSTYIENRVGDFVGYAPQQAALAENGIVVSNGKYILLLICSDPAAAKTAFLNCFGEISSKDEIPTTPAETPPDKLGNGSASSTASTNPIDTIETDDNIVPEEPPNTEQIPVSETANSTKPSASETITPTVPANSVQVDPNYNSDAILQAWSSGDTSALGEVNLNIYNAAKDVIDQNITSSMSDYEKELAIHDWITGWSSFSMSAFSHAPGGKEEYNVNTPYGVLIDRSGTCWGYSATFQLFMDMLRIECITVYGNPNGSGVEHTWNQVKLDDEWYCVDTAWDDPIGGRPGHSYFNLTSEAFRRTGIHQWDETGVPEAIGTKYSYGS